MALMFFSGFFPAVEISLTASMSDGKIFFADKTFSRTAKRARGVPRVLTAQAGRSETFRCRFMAVGAGARYAMRPFFVCRQQEKNSVGVPMYATLPCSVSADEKGSFGVPVRAGVFYLPISIF